MTHQDLQRIHILGRIRETEPQGRCRESDAPDFDAIQTEYGACSIRREARKRGRKNAKQKPTEYDHQPMPWTLLWMPCVGLL